MPMPTTPDDIRTYTINRTLNLMLVDYRRDAAKDKPTGKHGSHKLGTNAHARERLADHLASTLKTAWADYAKVVKKLPASTITEWVNAATTEFAVMIEHNQTEIALFYAGVKVKTAKPKTRKTRKTARKTVKKVS